MRRGTSTTRARAAAARRHPPPNNRQEGQFAPSELDGADLKAELLAKERAHALKLKGVSFEDEKAKDLALLDAAS